MNGTLRDACITNDLSLFLKRFERTTADECIDLAVDKGAGKVCEWYFANCCDTEQRKDILAKWSNRILRMETKRPWHCAFLRHAFKDPLLFRNSRGFFEVNEVKLLECI